MSTASFVSKRAKAADAQNDLVEAVVLLRSPADGSVPAPAQSKAMAAAVLSQVARETGGGPQASTVFENMHSFSVRASRQFVTALAHADDVAQVLPNAVHGPALIEPVDATPVKLPQ